MQYSAAQEEILVSLSETILNAFGLIEKTARWHLNQPPGPVDELLPQNAQQFLTRMRSDIRSSLSTLLREPAIARVEVYWPDKGTTERIYICRASAAGILPQGLSGRVVSYRAALGRLAEIPAGESEEVILQGGRRLADVQERVQLHPRLVMLAGILVTVTSNLLNGR